jgi:hypothetical protein
VQRAYGANDRARFARFSSRPYTFCTRTDGVFRCDRATRGGQFAAMRLRASAIVLAGVTAACGISQRVAPAPLMNEAMWEAGLRFHRVERDARDGRWELVRADIAELDAVFRGDIARARHDERVDIHRLAGEFAVAHFPSLDSAARTHDEHRFIAALAAVASSCNDCHRATSNPPIDVPVELQTAAR